MEEFKVRDAQQEAGYREFETFDKIYRPLIQRGWLKKQFTE